MHGQHRKIDPSRVMTLKRQGLSNVQIARRLGVSNVAIHRVLRETVCGHPNDPHRPVDGRSTTGRSE